MTKPTEPGELPERVWSIVCLAAFLTGVLIASIAESLHISKRTR